LDNLDLGLNILCLHNLSIFYSTNKCPRKTWLIGNSNQFFHLSLIIYLEILLLEDCSDRLWFELSHNKSFLFMTNVKKWISAIWKGRWSPFLVRIKRFLDFYHLKLLCWHFYQQIIHPSSRYYLSDGEPNICSHCDKKWLLTKLWWKKPFKISCQLFTAMQNFQGI